MLRIIGAVQLRQLRMDSSKCKVPTKFKESIDICFAPKYKPNKNSYGPPNDRLCPCYFRDSPSRYEYQSDVGETFWSLIEEGTFPKGGFVQTLDPADSQNMLNRSLELQVSTYKL